MSRSNRGAGYFEADGRRAASRPGPFVMRAAMLDWPAWARRAWSIGYMEQRQKVGC